MGLISAQGEGKSTGGAVFRNSENRNAQEQGTARLSTGEHYILDCNTASCLVHLTDYFATFAFLRSDFAQLIGDTNVDSGT
jgi:hypothetical protein